MAKKAVANELRVSMTLKGFFNQHASCRARETVNDAEFRELTHALAHSLALDPTPTTVAGVPSWFRQGFYGGLGLALLIGLFLIWLWQPERQVNRHTENFLRTIEKRNWTGAIARAFWNGCAKFCAICAVFELT